jgi:hypothetical protein
MTFPSHPSDNSNYISGKETLRIIYTCNVVSYTFEDQPLSFIRKNSGWINWNEYPIKLDDTIIKIEDFKNYILPILAETQRSPLQILNLTLHQLPHRSIIVELQNQYIKAIEAYKDSFQEACHKDCHEIDKCNENSGNDPISWTKSLWNEKASTPEKISTLIAGPLSWILGAEILIPFMRDEMVHLHSSYNRINWIQEVKKKEFERINNMKELVLSTLNELKNKDPQSFLSYTVTVGEEIQRLKLLLMHLGFHIFPEKIIIKESKQK